MIKARYETLPEWIVGDGATPDAGYDHGRPYTYLIRAVPPRFILRYDPLEFVCDDELGTIELPPEAVHITWIDPQPGGDVLAVLLASAMRVIVACEEQDRRQCERLEEQ